MDFRAKEMGIDLVLQKVADKARALEGILKKEKISPEQVCYVGDDLVDLGVLSRVGLAVAVADAVPEVKALAHYITQSSGGQGAVREICERILQAQMKWKKTAQRYFPPSSSS